ncbi:MAG: ABC transporter permease [Acidobacteriaceae bacterium]|nr:ABC transporter permease [Acidobacteriaceae bacterium]MBV9781649.1 ABC transporter permease [Acidobacteriaceae bacterium]
MNGQLAVSRYGADLALAAQNLWSQKTRTVLTTLGIIFGVGAVIGMLAIGAGAKEESLRFIEQMGVHNVLVEAHPASSLQEVQQRRRSSPGLTPSDVRILKANVDGLALISARKSMHPSVILPKPDSPAVPELYGVAPEYAQIHDWQMQDGTTFDAANNDAAAAVAVLGERAKVSMLGYGKAVATYIKVNDSWLRVIGVLKEQITSSSGAQSIDPNYVIYVPLNTFQYRFFDPTAGFLKDELDGIDIRMNPNADSIRAARVVDAILASTHHNTPDYSVTIPAELLAQQQRAQSIFTYVMVAIAAISLLVGGIGIMNIVLATVLERTREIGVRRASGARRADIIRQFLVESVLISLAGGAVGIAFGYLLSWLIAAGAHWKTIVTPFSVVIAFGVSVAVGVLFGIYPARQASLVDPIEALRYE